MTANESPQTSFHEEPKGQGQSRRQPNKASKRVTESSAMARRARLDAEAEASEQAAKTGAKSAKLRLQANRRSNATPAWSLATRTALR
jgi:hypothetical protein